MTKLTQADIKVKIEKLNGWTSISNPASIKKEYKFQNFTDAVCFLNRIAEIAEQENHHPDLHLVGYNKLTVVLSTHSAGGVTSKDFILAQKIEEIRI